ncbi:hypothetical protein HK097_008269 [Rhizophlyctis rosea]|uniref:alpha-galactosidase n=1 Tax=Rhizophlyctis rosea TaxID=64517 RepID=A0AAD5SI99_9FUNG|nr:hypothetical protein HK097_008269 [Rhizophlyctis rosea]
MKLSLILALTALLASSVTADGYGKSVVSATEEGYSKTGGRNSKGGDSATAEGYSKSGGRGGKGAKGRKGSKGGKGRKGGKGGKGRNGQDSGEGGYGGNGGMTGGRGVRDGGRCGVGFDNAVCGSNLCCSIYGYCGKTTNHCSANQCQKSFGTCNGSTGTPPKNPTYTKNSTNTKTPTYTKNPTATTKAPGYGPAEPNPTYAPPAAGSWWKPAAYPITWQIQYPGTLNLDKIQSAVTSNKLSVMNVDLFDITASQVSKMHSMGVKVVCYFSAGSYEDWRPDVKDFPSDIRAASYDGWEGEWWLDLKGWESANGGDSVLKSIMGKRIKMAKDKKCDAVDPDNVDSYTNNVGNTAAQQLNYNKWLAATAHSHGLAISLKNDPGQIKELLPHFDFAVTEECVEDNMCEEWNPFVAANKPVFAISYSGSCGKLNGLKQNGLLKNLDLDEQAKDCTSALTYGGTGCPSGTAAVLIAADKKSFAVLFDDYTISVSPETRRQRKACLLAFELLFPQGYSYSIGTINHRGSAFLDKGVTGALTANYFFAGNPIQATKTTPFVGPYAQNNYVIADTFDLQAVVWSPCGQNVPLTLSSSLRLDAGTTGKGSGELTTDSSEWQSSCSSSF